MQTTENELKAQISALLQKATNTNEAEKNEPDLDIPAELERRQVWLAAIEAATARLEEHQRQSDAQCGRYPDDERQPKDKDGTRHRGSRVVNTSSEVQQLPMVLAAVKTYTSSAAGQVLADAG